MSTYTDVHNAHRYVSDMVSIDRDCTCGWFDNGGAPVFSHARHVESELLAAGIVAVQLPEANGHHNKRWITNAQTIAVLTDEDYPIITGTTAEYTANEARAYAAALLAAANAADKVQLNAEPQ